MSVRRDLPFGDHLVAGRRILGTGEVATQPGNLGYIGGQRFGGRALRGLVFDRLIQQLNFNAREG